MKKILKIFSKKNRNHDLIDLFRLEYGKEYNYALKTQQNINSDYVYNFLKSQNAI